MFYVIDGPDGAGKTTQAARIAEFLRARGETVTVLREPGATPAGEAIRDLLLDPDTDLTATAEMLLYQAARAHVVESVIRPALKNGSTVLLVGAYESMGDVSDRLKVISDRVDSVLGESRQLDL